MEIALQGAEAGQDEGEEEVVGDLLSCGRVCLLLVFPFLNMRQPPEERPQLFAAPQWWHRCTCRSTQAMLVCSGIFWIVLVSVLLYVLLTISSFTFEMRRDATGKYAPMRKEPAVGKDFSLALLGNHVILFLMLQYLCNELMTPLAGARDRRIEHLHMNQPWGVIHACRWAMNRICCRTHEALWLSSFMPDHLLLMFTGFFAILNEAVMCLAKLGSLSHGPTLHWVEERLEAGSLPASIGFVLEAATSVYLIVLIIGFLWTTLEYNVVARSQYKKEFYACASVIAVLWFAHFFCAVYDRQVYNSAWLGVQNYQRFIAAIAQVFVTHSTAMLGTVIGGHSGHFQKCPDITWEALGFKIVPILVLYLGLWSLIARRRSAHTHASCSPVDFELIAEPWTYVESATMAIVGGILLFLALHPPAPAPTAEPQAEHAAGDEPGVPLDSLAPAPAEEEAAGDEPGVPLDSLAPAPAEEDRAAGEEPGVPPDSLAAAPAEEDWVQTPPPHAGAEEPEGPDSLLRRVDYDTLLIIFTFCPAVCWYVMGIFEAEAARFTVAFIFAFLELLAPLGLATFTVACWMRPPRRGTWHSCALWLAFAFSLTMFTVFQEKEDCEISSSLPGCCSFPGMPGFNTDRKRLECDVERRCLIAPADHVYCSMADSETTNATAFAHKGLDFPLEQCPLLSSRWEAYVEISAEGVSHAMQDFEHEEDKRSIASRIFVSIGQAANVEMYFTIFGILLKILIFNQHPEGERIMRANSFHEHSHAGHPHAQRARSV